MRMEVKPYLPTVKDFKMYGKFHNIIGLDLYSEVPLQILYHIYPDYLFQKETIAQDTLELIKTHCIIMKEQAKYEDHVEYLKNLKELQIRRLEDRIHYFYLFKKSVCKCSVNKNSI